MISYFKNSAWILFFTLISGFAYSASNQNTGIALGATRVIYPLNAKQTSLSVINHSPKERFLINSWVENENGKEKNFVITPPLFVMEPNSENTLRIVNLADNLPKDRESVFWLNVKAIPSVDKDSLEGKNVLQLAILSRIKLFVRPDNLSIQTEDAAEKIKFNQKGGTIYIDNPSPYYTTLVNIVLDGHPLDNVMVAPFTIHQIQGKSGQKLTYQSINDYGGLRKQREVSLK
ncbi:fimbria/pilus periplasmic chaperone [Morganella psychrotolerans]|uniref:fimbria/pilus periplasmic chaperone n=1 Tax=Morganella psychrotolerans TaxID=368603 RepID=UPI0039AF13A4